MSLMFLRQGLAKSKMVPYLKRCMICVYSILDEMVLKKCTRPSLSF